MCDKTVYKSSPKNVAQFSVRGFKRQLTGRLVVWFCHPLYGANLVLQFIFSITIKARYRRRLNIKIHTYFYVSNLVLFIHKCIECKNGIKQKTLLNIQWKYLHYQFKNISETNFLTKINITNKKIPI